MIVGFTAYDDPVVPPTTAELLALLTGTQRSGILNYFAEGRGPTDVKIDFGVRLDVVLYFYGILHSMEIYAAQVMRGEVSGVTPPTDQAGLLTEMEAQFIDFTSAQLNAMLNKMIEYSKADGTGDWAWYSSRVVL